MLVRFFDVEADGLLKEATTVHCAVFKDLESGEVVKFRPHQMKEFLLFMDTCDVVIGHNIIDYDLPLLEKIFEYNFKGKKVDTLLMSRLLNPKRLVPINAKNNKATPHSLYSWGVRVGVDKPDYENWEVFTEEMLDRCTADVEITELTYESLMGEAKGSNWGPAFKLTFELFENLHKQSEYGWAVDKSHMTRCIKTLERYMRMIDRVVTPQLPNILEIEETKKEGQYNYVKKPFLKSGEKSGSVVNWNGPKDCVSGPFSRLSFRKVDLNSGLETKQFLLDAGWQPSEWNEDDEGNRTSPKLSKDDPFEGVEGPVGRLVARRVQARQRKGIIEGLQTLVRADGRIASVVNNLAVTARGIHRNIVNIPKAGSFFGKQMRQIFTSKPGYVLVGTDSDGCQLRMLAGRMNNPVYTEALCNGDKKNGTDNHSLTAAIGELESRDIAKNVMYCLLFGGGDAKLAKTAKKPSGSGSELRLRLYRGLDGLGNLVEKLTKEWKATAKQRYNSEYRKMEYYNGYITGLDGRPIQVSYEHQLLVYLLQSDEAIMMTRAYNTIWKELSNKYKFKEDFGVVCFYHDEVNVECREEIADDVMKITEEAIAEAGRFYKISCPHLGQAKKGRTWYSVH